MLHCYHTELTVILINSDTGNERDLTLILSSFSFSLSFMFLFLFLLIIHVYLHSNSHDRISVKESKTRYLRFISQFFLSLSPFLFNLCTKYIHNKQRIKEEHVKSTNIMCVHSNVRIKAIIFCVSTHSSLNSIFLDLLISNILLTYSSLHAPFKFSQYSNVHIVQQSYSF